MRFMSVMYCQTFVSPAIGATLHTFLLRNALITDDLPTFGYPMKPTLICFLSTCSLPICRSRLMSAPFPNGCVREAWNAIVGYSLLSIATQRCVTQIGTRSTLFRMKNRCLCGFSLRRNVSIYFDRVPIGSRASNTCSSTSAESITL
uniref:Putative secreted protein n=1 Tax=Anopheles triannulatus TaxID=58253 RepID=A0A2M4B1M3_9DIPT